MDTKRRISNAVITVISVGIVAGFLIGAYEAVISTVSHRYVHYRLFNLALYDFQHYLVKWMITVPVILLIAYGALFLSGRLWKHLYNWVQANLLEITVKDQQEYHHYVISLRVSILFFVVGGYVINHFYLPEIFSIQSYLGNIGILLFSLGLFVSTKILLSSRRLLRGMQIIGKPLSRVRGTGGVIRVISMILFSVAIVFNGAFFVYHRLYAPQGQNVLLIAVDTLRADHLGCYGYERNNSPNIDGLATEGMLFRNCMSQSSWTLPSIATIMTSVYPTVHQAIDKGKRIPDEFVTLAEVLKNNFYRTAGIISGVYVTSTYGFNQGFSLFDEEEAGYGDAISSHNVTRKAMNFLRKNGEKPFFLFLHYFDPHYIWFEHEEYDYYPHYTGDLFSGQEINDIRVKGGMLGDDDIRYLKSLYDSEISFTDKHIGDVLKELRRLDLYDNTMIIFTADHGEEFLERGWLGHIRTLFSELIHVPLIIKLANSRFAKTVTDEVVGTIDIYPTVVNELKLRVVPEIIIQGKTLLDAQGMKTEVNSRPIFSEVERVSIFKGPHRDKQKIVKKAVIHGKWKLIEDKDHSLELYDLSSDRFERNNVVSENGAIREELKGYLKRWREGNRAIMDHRGVSNEVVVDDELKAKLKSLGYIN
jgi:arylsulfatase A-like enzyme